MLLLELFLLLNTIKAAQILGIFAFPGKSHSMMYKTIMKELALRGHEVSESMCTILIVSKY